LRMTATRGEITEFAHDVVVDSSETVAFPGGSDRQLGDARADIEGASEIYVWNQSSQQFDTTTDETQPDFEVAVAVLPDDNDVVFAVEHVADSAFQSGHTYQEGLNVVPAATHDSSDQDQDDLNSPLLFGTEQSSGDATSATIKATLSGPGEFQTYDGGEGQLSDTTAIDDDREDSITHFSDAEISPFAGYTVFTQPDDPEIGQSVQSNIDGTPTLEDIVDDGDLQRQ